MGARSLNVPVCLVLVLALNGCHQAFDADQLIYGCEVDAGQCLDGYVCHLGENAAIATCVRSELVPPADGEATVDPPDTTDGDVGPEPADAHTPLDSGDGPEVKAPDATSEIVDTVDAPETAEDISDVGSPIPDITEADVEPEVTSPVEETAESDITDADSSPEDTEPGPDVPAGPVTCDGAVCPTLEAYTASCAESLRCLYTRTKPSETWHEHDTWILMPAAAFSMGATDEEVEAYVNGEVSAPQMEVNLGYPLLVSALELTTAHYEAYAIYVATTCDEVDPVSPYCNAVLLPEDQGSADNLSSEGVNLALNHWDVGGGEDHPQNGLTWSLAKTLCAFFSPGGEELGRLPSEAEWESAANGPGSHHLYPWGDPAAVCGTHAVFKDVSDPQWAGCAKNGGTHSVGTSPDGASAIGALDMAGNVQEWTLDCWKDSLTGHPTDGKPDTGSGECSSHVTRGGSLLSPGIHATSDTKVPNDLRTAHRSSRPNSENNPTVGVRCVRCLPGDDTLCSEITQENDDGGD